MLRSLSFIFLGLGNWTILFCGSMQNFSIQIVLMSLVFCRSLSSLWFSWSSRIIFPSFQCQKCYNETHKEVKPQGMLSPYLYRNFESLNCIQFCSFDIVIIQILICSSFLAVDCCAPSWCPSLQWPWEVC